MQGRLRKEKRRGLFEWRKSYWLKVIWILKCYTIVLLALSVRRAAGNYLSMTRPPCLDQLFLASLSEFTYRHTGLTPSSPTLTLHLSIVSTGLSFTFAYARAQTFSARQYCRTDVSRSQNRTCAQI